MGRTYCCTAYFRDTAPQTATTCRANSFLFVLSAVSLRFPETIKSESSTISETAETSSGTLDRSVSKNARNRCSFASIPPSAVNASPCDCLLCLRCIRRSTENRTPSPMTLLRPNQKGIRNLYAHCTPPSRRMSLVRLSDCSVPRISPNNSYGVNTEDCRPICVFD